MRDPERPARDGRGRGGGRAQAAQAKPGSGRKAACPRSGPVEGVWGNREVPPAAFGHFISSCRRRRRSRKGRGLEMYGSLSKLCSGGGEVVYHSSVSPRHGSFPTRRAFRERQTFTRNTRVPSPSRNEPMLETTFHVSHHGASG